MGVLLVYAGIVLLLGSWFVVARSLADPRGVGRATVRRLVPVLAAWVVPLLVAGPLFSRDAYSYAAGGELASKGINPFLHAPVALGGGPFLIHVDAIWRQAIPPYGPAWERLVEGFVLATGHRLLGVLVLLKLTALVSLAVIAWGVPALARSTGHDPSRAFTWAVLNPLVLLTLLGGMHNDILMMALVVAGLVFALRGHPLAGTATCAVGAGVKAPALLAVVFIAWWSGEGERPAKRWLLVLGHLALAVGVAAALGAVSGLGWGWIGATLTPGKVVSWLDPATAVGLGLDRLAQVVGLGAHKSFWLAAARSVGIAAAVAVSIRMLLRSDRRTVPRSLGVSLLAFALLGPVVWPWYETWGILLMATAADEAGRWEGRLVVGLSALGCFADFPSARVLVGAAPALVAAGWTVLVLAAAAYLRFEVARPPRVSRGRLRAVRARRG